MPAVFLCPIDIGGIYSCLARGFREIGCKTDFLNIGTDTNGAWDRSESSFPVRLYIHCHWFVERWRGKGNFHLLRLISILYWFLAQFILISWVCIRFDIVVSKSCQSIGFRDWEFWLYRKLGLKVIVIFQGSDSRPPFLRPVFDAESPSELAQRVIETRARVDKARKNAHFVVDNPLSSQNQTGVCCIYQFIGIVVDDHKLEPGYRIARRLKEEIRESKGQPVTILHSPSLPAIKGTKRIRSCIDSLKVKGFDIAYVELTGRSNKEVAEALARCDFVIDQLYSDIHGAIFATEAAAFGKPAVVCGYGKEALEKFVPQEATFPSVFAHPDSLESVMEKLIVDADYRLECGAASLHYFTNFGDRREIARRLLVLASGEAPQSWFFDPNDVHYVEGVGGTNGAIAANIRKLVNHSGDKGLLMDDKPILKQRILELAQRIETSGTGAFDGQ